MVLEQLNNCHIFRWEEVNWSNRCTWHYSKGLFIVMILVWGWYKLGTGSQELYDRAGVMGFWIDVVLTLIMVSYLSFLFYCSCFYSAAFFYLFCFICCYFSYACHCPAIQIQFMLCETLLKNLERKHPSNLKGYYFGLYTIVKSLSIQNEMFFIMDFRAHTHYKKWGFS